VFMKTETYEAKVVCSNCTYSGVSKIPKGRRVSEVLCPNCSCDSLQLQPKATWKTETREFKINVDKKLDKLNEMFDSLGKNLDELFK
jgi:hypothetical protein